MLFDSKMWIGLKFTTLLEILATLQGPDDILESRLLQHLPIDLPFTLS